MGTIVSGGILMRNEDILQAHPIDQGSFDTLVARKRKSYSAESVFTAQHMRIYAWKVRWSF